MTHQITKVLDGVTHYGPWRIEYNPKPIPASCGVDWDWYHEDYGGPGDPRCGTAASFEAAVREIRELELDSVQARECGR